jgi:hypothetical protein
MDSSTFLNILLARYPVPRKNIISHKVRFSEEEIALLAGTITNPETVIGIIESNAWEMSETIVQQFLAPLGEGYTKIANRQGKIVDNDPLMNILLQLLKDMGILIADYTPKNKKIEVEYILY